MKHTALVSKWSLFHKNIPLNMVHGLTRTMSGYSYFLEMNQIFK